MTNRGSVWPGLEGGLGRFSPASECVASKQKRSERSTTVGFSVASKVGLCLSWTNVWIYWKKLEWNHLNRATFLIFKFHHDPYILNPIFHNFLNTLIEPYSMATLSALYLSLQIVPPEPQFRPIDSTFKTCFTNSFYLPKLVTLSQTSIVELAQNCGSGRPRFVWGFSWNFSTSKCHASKTVRCCATFCSNKTRTVSVLGKKLDSVGKS